MEALRLIGAGPRIVDDFRDALQFFDVGSQNWAYADVNGNIAYFTSAELPLREDLQTFPFVPAGLQPPYFIRDGTHTNKHDWMPRAESAAPSGARTPRSCRSTRCRRSSTRRRVDPQRQQRSDRHHPRQRAVERVPSGIQRPCST